MAELLAEVEAVADDEGVGDLEADVVDGDVDQTPGRLVKQGADLDGRWALRLQV